MTALCMPFAAAQAPLDRLEDQPLQLVEPQEAAELRRILATPIAQTADARDLSRQYADKVRAAQRLGDRAVRNQWLRAAIAELPSESRWRNELALVLQDERRWDDSRRMFEAAIELARTEPLRLLYDANLVGLLVARYADDEAQARGERVRQSASALLPDTPPSERRYWLLRALGALANHRASLYERRGLWTEQLDAARQSRQILEEARSIAETAKRSDWLEFLAPGMMNAMRSSAAASRRLGRLQEAEATLLEQLQFLQSARLSPGYAAGAHHALAALRIAQREYARAERQLRLSLQIVDGLQDAPDSVSRIDKVRDLALVLWAQGRHADASGELQRLEQKATRAGKALIRARTRFERGLVYLHTGRPVDAAQAFGELAERNLQSYGAGHLFVVQAFGLQGVALWKTGEPAGRERGAELLKQAVLDYQSPRTTDAAYDIGVLRAVRELVFATYLEVATHRGGLPALWAMGVADSLRGGVTHQAMADAAVRAAARDPMLAELVRKEQDARNEQLALQASLEGADSTDALPAEAAARMRSRSDELLRVRQDIQQRIRDRFPGYDRLVRPPLSNPADVAQRLGRDEALVLLMPNAEALHIWAMTADQLPEFVRVDVSEARLKALVLRLRRTLDFGQATGVPRFDAPASRELYRSVLEPVAARLAGKRSLVVAAAGPLAMLPFAALLTGDVDERARLREWPWLIKQLAVTQVPSVAAWLALRELPPSRRAPEALIGWGDPLFARAGPPVANAGTSTRRLAVARAPASGSATASLPAAIFYDQLPALPETRDELLGIAASLGASVEQDLVFGPQATRASVLEASRSGRLARKRVVVFATHGLMAGDLPGLQQPALALAAGTAPADPLAPLLTLEDVLGLVLNADWVVLSACNTAAADGKAEESLSGLARGFLYSGARSLLVTQWAVETESAKLLTTHTFRFHTSDPARSKAESLRLAMVQVMETATYGHPAFWAPYMLVGEGAR